MHRLALLPLALAAATPALAQEGRDLCADRPGANDAPCIVDAGRLQLETGLSWSRTEEGAAREDTFLVADTALRYGVGPRTELRLAITAFGSVDTSGAGSDQGLGDLTIGIRHSLANPDGSGTSVAIQGFVTVPTGSGPLTAGEWSAGAALPMSFELTPTISFAATPQIAAAADADGDGQHLAVGSAAGFNFSLSDRFSAGVDVAIVRDDDPAGSSTQATTGLSFAFQASGDVQLDIGAVAGLNRDTPDVEIYAGFVTRF